MHAFTLKTIIFFFNCTRFLVSYLTRHWFTTCIISIALPFILIENQENLLCLRQYNLSTMRVRIFSSQSCCYLQFAFNFFLFLLIIELTHFVQLIHKCIYIVNYHLFLMHTRWQPVTLLDTTALVSTCMVDICHCVAFYFKENNLSSMILLSSQICSYVQFVFI